MRILVSIIKFEQGWGGAPESVRLLARRLAPLGVQCDVVTNGGFRADVAGFDLLPEPATETEHLPAGTLARYDAFLIAGPWQPWRRLRHILRALPASARVIYLPRGGLAMAEFRRPRDLKKFPYLALIEQRLIERSERIVFSSDIENRETRLIGRQMGKRVVVPDFVELVPASELLRSSAGPFTATFMAEVAPRKGLLALLSALDTALKRGKVPRDMVLNVGGSIRPGSEAYYARCRIAAARLPTEVRFLGSVGHDRRAALYAQTDLFITPSRFESFGLTVIEALSAGCRLMTAPDLGSLEYIPRSRMITIATAPTSAALAQGWADALAANPGRVNMIEAAKTRATCDSAIAEINRLATDGWQALLA